MSALASIRDRSLTQGVGTSVQREKTCVSVDKNPLEYLEGQASSVVEWQFSELWCWSRFWLPFRLSDG